MPATTFVDCNSKITLLFGVTASKAGEVCGSTEAPLCQQCEHGVIPVSMLE